jgi:hypothetical protein
VVPPGVSKQTGITFLADYLGVKRADTIAVGDETNDIEMLQGAGLAIVVQNANPLAKAAAHVVTARTNNEDAMAEVIDNYVLA